MEQMSDHDFNRILLTYSRPEWPRTIGVFCCGQLNGGYMSEKQFTRYINMFADSEDTKYDSMKKEIESITSTQLLSIMIFLYYNCISVHYIEPWLKVLNEYLSDDTALPDSNKFQWHHERFHEDWKYMNNINGPRMKK